MYQPGEFFLPAPSLLSTRTGLIIQEGMDSDRDWTRDFQVKRGNNPATHRQMYCFLIFLFIRYRARFRVTSGESPFQISARFISPLPAFLKA